MNLIKKYWILIVCGLAILGVAIFQHKLFPPAATSPKGTSVIAQPRQYTDAAGTVHTETKVAQVEKATGNDSYLQHKIDSMAKVLNEKEKYIKALVQLNLQQSGSFYPVYTDTTGKVVQILPGNDTVPFIPVNTMVSYSDKYLSISGKLYDTSSWRYSISESLTIATHEKKKGWLGLSRELTVDVSSNNPNTRIIGLSGITIIPKPKRWGIGFNVGYGYNGNQWSPMISIGIQRNFIRF